MIAELIGRQDVLRILDFGLAGDRGVQESIEAGTSPCSIGRVCAVAPQGEFGDVPERQLFRQVNHGHAAGQQVRGRGTSCRVFQWQDSLFQAAGSFRMRQRVLERSLDLWSHVHGDELVGDHHERPGQLAGLPCGAHRQGGQLGVEGLALPLRR